MTIRLTSNHRRHKGLVHEDPFVATEHAIQKIATFLGCAVANKAFARFRFGLYNADVVFFAVHPRFFLKHVEVLVQSLFGCRQEDFTVQEQLIAVLFQLGPWKVGAGSSVIRFQNGIVVWLHVGIVKHIDRVPRADRELVKLTAVVWRPIAHLAADAAAGIDLMVALRGNRADDFVDTVNRTHCRAGIAGRAVVLVDDVDITSFLLPVRLSSPEVVSH